MTPRLPLSPREEEVLGLLKQGLFDEEIAYRLKIRPKTVACHKSSIHSKLGLERYSTILQGIARLNSPS